MDKFFLEPVQTLKLLSYENNFKNFHTLYKEKKLPKVIMISGEKGIGKFTFINHFIISLLDKNNYNFKNLSISSKSTTYKEIISKTSSNVIIIKGDTQIPVKIDDIRKLKETISKSTLNNCPRFIILDEINLYNLNCQNSLLKIIEEPTKNNYFILINNNTSKISDTIRSRVLEFKFYLSEKDKKIIIQNFLKNNSLNDYFDNFDASLSPGKVANYIYLCHKEKIELNDQLINVVETLLGIYKKSKNYHCISLVKYLINLSIYKNLTLNKNSLEILIDRKNKTMKHIDDFVTYNLNHNTTLQLISQQIG